MRKKTMNTSSWKQNLCLLLAMLLMLGTLTPAAFAAEEYVAPIAPFTAGYDATASNHDELAAAIDAAPGAIHPGQSAQWVIAITQDFSLTGTITIQGLRNVHLVSYGTDPNTGEGPNRFTITAAPGMRHFAIGSPLQTVPRTTLTLSNIILDGGRPAGTDGNGGGILNGHQGDSGFMPSDVILRSNAVIQNSRWSIGGAVQHGFVFMHGNSEIRYNEATDRGGGVGAAALEMHDYAQIHSNHAANDGGGFYGAVQLAPQTGSMHDNARIHNNTAGRRGGGVFIGNTASMDSLRMFTMTESMDDDPDFVSGVINNHVLSAGNLPGEQTVPHSWVMSHHGGGGIFGHINATINIHGGHVRDNTVQRGPAVNVDAVYGGGGVMMDSGAESATLNITGGTISDNSVFHNDTAIGADTHNARPGGVGGGVLMFNGANLNMTGGVIENNEAPHRGGGLDIRGSGIHTLTAGRIYNNTVREGDGGGVHFMRATNLILGGNMVIEGNRAQDRGGGVFFIGGQASGGTVLLPNRRLEMQPGAQIIGNSAHDGGGVFLAAHNRNASAVTPQLRRNLRMLGGVIGYNEAAYRGGGVFLETLPPANTAGTVFAPDIANGAVWSHTAFHMLDGAVTGNRAGRYGGGVFVQSIDEPRGSTAEHHGHFNMTGGALTYNEAVYGGGAYVMRYGRMTAHNAAIRGNIAQEMGGGIFTERYRYEDILPLEPIPAFLAAPGLATDMTQIEYSNLLLSNIAFSGNQANRAYQPPVNALSAVAAAAWNALSARTHPLNNFDINYRSPLTLHKEANQAMATPGDRVTYTLTVRNVREAGEVTEPHTVVDTIDPRLTFQADTLAVAGLGAGEWSHTFNPTTGELRVTLNRIPVGETAVTITFDVIVGQTSGSIPNIAQLRDSSEAVVEYDDATVEVVFTPQPEVTIEKTAEQTAVLQDENIVYTITVTNAGPGTATNVVVTDPLADSVTFIGTTAEDADHDPVTNVLTVTLGDLAAGETVSFTVTVRADELGEVENTATVSGDNFQSEADSATVIVDPQPEPDDPEVTIEKTAERSLVLLGEDIIYTITATNAGPGTATNVVVTDPLADSVTFIGTTAEDADHDPVTNVLTVTLGDLAAGETASFTVTVRADELGEVENTATVSGDNFQSEADSVTVTVDPQPVIPLAPTLEKRAGSSTVNAGGTIVYTITVRNPNAIALGELAVVDPLDSRVSFVADSVQLNGADVPYTFTDGNLRVALASLSADGVYVITFRVTVLPTATGQTIRNTAILEDADGEEVDRDTVDVTVPGGSSGGGGGGGQLPPDEGSGNGNGTEPEAPWRQAFLIGRNVPGASKEDRPIAPHDNITRAEIATIIFRLIEDQTREEHWRQTNPFNDVALEQWFNNAISTTTHMGLFRGITENTFAPGQDITRAELAAVLVRFMERDQIGQFSAAVPASGDAFPDIADHWAKEYINRAAEKGWVRGFPDGTFGPRQVITRAEAAAMINRMFERLIESPECRLDDMITWYDNQNPESWFFLYMYMATNSYTYQWDGRVREDGLRLKDLVEIINPRRWEVLERPWSEPGHILQTPSL